MDLTSPLPFRHQREVHMPKPLEIPATLLRLEGMASETDSFPSSISPHTSNPPPRSPLPPHKLAKIANALGVNTPMPAFFRSPSPSGSSFRTPSKYLLHVVPPAFLPIDEDDDGSDPDGASSVSASSYRSQFRRGTLIPLYPTLHSQLGAIAREYNLPSTGGLVLYLVQSSQDGVQDGPRISEDVWKLLWHKALQAERQDSQPRSVSALALPSGRSTPSSPYTAQNRDASQHLSPTSRFPPSPLPPSPLPLSPLPYPSPSTSSTPSLDVQHALLDKDNASTSDLGSIISEITPNPFLPIMAKVEFDIDRRKAGWFDAWIHAKRDRSRWRTANEGGKLPLALPDQADSRTRLRRFLTDTSTPSESSDYVPLDDGEGDKTAVDENGDKATIVLHHKDPLEDVFGSDAATWGEMHSVRQRKPTGLGISSPHPELIIPPDGEGPENEDIKIQDEDDVRKLWDENKRPRLAVNPPDLRASPRKSAPPPLNIRSTTESKKQQSANTGSFLPYLNNRTPSDSGSSTQETQNEKQAKRRTGMVFGDLEVKVVAEPEEMTDQDLAHRSSQIVMKHKLDQLEKQLAQLSPRQLRDHKQSRLPTERVPYSPLRSAPPGEDRFNLSPPTHVKGARSLNPTPRRPEVTSTRQVDDRIPLRKDSLGAIVYGQPTRLQEHKRAQSSQSSSGSSSLKSHLEQPPGLTRPSAAHSSRGPPPSPSSPPATRPNGRPQERTPPQLTVKRASAGQRKGDVSEETKARKFSDGQELPLPPLPNSTLDGDSNGLVIPLSPDPFSKLPVEDLRSTRPSIDSSRSNESRPPSRLQQGTVLPSFVPENTEAANPTSRFSADSEQGVEQLSKQRRRSNSVMSVRGIRNLWRKSTVSNKTNEMPPPVPTEPTPSLPIRASASSHSRENSSLSQRSTRLPTERRRSATLRPDSGADPFQFDNANIYKSASSSSLSSATQGGSSAPSPAPVVGANHASSAGSIGRSSKGILKGRPGNVIQLDPEARKARQSIPGRTVSTASTQLSDAGEPSADLRPSSPPDVRSAAAARRKTEALMSPIELPPLSHSLPTSGILGLSKLSSSTPSFTSSLDDSAISHLSEFEMVSPPMRSTPSASYNGEVF